MRIGILYTYHYQTFHLTVCSQINENKVQELVNITVSANGEWKLLQTEISYHEPC